MMKVSRSNLFTIHNSRARQYCKMIERARVSRTEELKKLRFKCEQWTVRKMETLSITKNVAFFFFLSFFSFLFMKWKMVFPWNPLIRFQCKCSKVNNCCWQVNKMLVMFNNSMESLHKRDTIHIYTYTYFDRFFSER